MFHEIPAERTALFRFIEPSDTKLTATYPFIDKHEKLDVLVRNYPSRNSGRHTVYQLDRRNRWSKKGSGTLGKNLVLPLPLNPHESKLIYVAPDENSLKDMNLGVKQ